MHTLGGLNGYCAGKSMAILYAPLLYGAALCGEAVQEGHSVSVQVLSLPLRLGTVCGWG